MLYLFCNPKVPATSPPPPSLEKSWIHPCRLILLESCFFEFEHCVQNELWSGSGYEEDVSDVQPCSKGEERGWNEVVRRWHRRESNEKIPGFYYPEFCFANFWYFGKIVAEERWWQSEVRLYYTLLLQYIRYLQDMQTNNYFTYSRWFTFLSFLFFKLILSSL